MSGDAPAATDAPPAADDDKDSIVLPPQGDAAFAALMDTLVAEEGDDKAAAGGAPAAADAGATGSAAAAPEGTEPKPADAGAPAAGEDGKPEVPAEGAAGDTGEPVGSQAAGDAGAGGDRPENWTKDASQLKTELGELSTAFEEKVTKSFKDDALDEVRKEFPKHFEAIELHPRMLVGVEVPSTTGKGMERLKDSADAKEWQDATKQLLVEEVSSRATKAIEENSALFETAHASLELFQNNPDLVPGSATFDKDLADAFVKMAQPYEMRVEGKLHGWSIPVQGLVNNIRAQVAADRAAKPAPKADEPKPDDDKTTEPKPKEDPPQAGVVSKAGAASQEEDYSTLFGTIGKGYENIRI